MSESKSRRSFLKTAAGVGTGAVGAAVSGACAADRVGATGDSITQAPVQKGSPVFALTAPKMETVRIALIGAGARGLSLLDLLLRIEGVEIRAVSDIESKQRDKALRMIAERRAATGSAESDGKGEPDATPDSPKVQGYSDSPEDYRKIAQRDDIDLFLIATPWRWHVPMAVEAMNNGKHVAVEVPAATTIDGCWQLVDTAERTQKHCMMMENCCYGEEELAVLNMCRKGLFGELLHGEAAYIHDLRWLLFSDESEGLWRTQHSVDRNGNLYPTHGLGPVAQYMNIGRGDRFESITSMSTNSRGMQEYARVKFGPNSEKGKMQFACGDMNTSLIRSALGRTIMIQHDTTSPRPYTRHNLIQGTRGTFSGYPAKVFVEGRSQEHGGWDEFESVRQEFRHPLWAALDKKATEAGGHGGMDFVMLWRLIYCLRNGLPLDQDVYDAAAWSVVSPLSEISVAERSRPVDFPDFTRGLWKEAKPLGIVEV